MLMTNVTNISTFERLVKLKIRYIHSQLAIGAFRGPFPPVTG
jgi:hypothetical protein